MQAVITLERNYAITHAMHLNKRLSLKHAAYIMVGAWTFSIFMASLPLFGVSDYRKFAVCLPFETDGPASKGYVIFLMVINGIAFFILMGCYLKMYCAIRGSQAWNSNDSRIAKRMALLVFTDFICWFPIAFFSLTAACGLQLISLEGAKVFTVFVLPLNSCCNPFLYAILTKQFKKDCVMICKAIEESRVTRGIGRCRHSSNFSNRQTPANTNSLNSGSGSGSHTKNSTHCNCNAKKVVKLSPRWPLDQLKSLLCGFKDSEELNSQNEWNYQIAEIQQKQQKTKRHASVSSENFSSSRSDSWKHGHCMPLRFVDHHRRRNSWTVTRKPSQDSNLSSSRNDSAGSNSTQSTNTWRMSRSSVSSELNNSVGRTGSGQSASSSAGPAPPTTGKFGALARAQMLQRGRGVPGIIKQSSAGQLAGQPGLIRPKPKLIRQGAVVQEGETACKQVSFSEPGSCPLHQESATGITPGNTSRYRQLYAKLTESSQEEEVTAACPPPTLLTPPAPQSKRLSLDSVEPPRSAEPGRRVSLGVTPGPGSLGSLAEPRYGPGRCTSENALLALQSKYGYSFRSAVSGSGIQLSKSDNGLSSAGEREEGGGAAGQAERATLLSPDRASVTRTATIQEESVEPGEADRLL